MFYLLPVNLGCTDIGAITWVAITIFIIVMTINCIC